MPEKQTYQSNPKLWTIIHNTFGIMAKGFRNKRANILQLTTGRKCCKSDTRISGLFVSKYGTVQVVMEINGSIMKQSIVRLARKSWYHFVIQQKLNEDNKVIHISFLSFFVIKLCFFQFIFKITVNSKMKWSLENPKPTKFKNVKAYAGIGKKIANAKVKNFDITTFSGRNIVFSSV